MHSTGDVFHDLGEFTSPNKLEFVDVNNANAYKGISKSMLELISPNEIKGTDVVDNRAVIQTWKRVK